MCRKPPLKRSLPRLRRLRAPPRRWRCEVPRTRRGILVPAHGSSPPTSRPAGCAAARRVDGAVAQLGGCIWRKTRACGPTCWRPCHRSELATARCYIPPSCSALRPLENRLGPQRATDGLGKSAVQAMSWRRLRIVVLLRAAWSLAHLADRSAEGRRTASSCQRRAPRAPRGGEPDADDRTRRRSQTRSIARPVRIQGWSRSASAGERRRPPPRPRGGCRAHNMLGNGDGAGGAPPCAPIVAAGGAAIAVPASNVRRRCAFQLPICNGAGRSPDAIGAWAGRPVLLRR